MRDDTIARLRLRAAALVARAESDPDSAADLLAAAKQLEDVIVAAQQSTPRIQRER